MAKKYVFETVIEVLAETRTVMSCPLDHKYDWLAKDKNDTHKHVGIKVVNAGAEIYFDDRLGFTIMEDSILSEPSHMRTLIHMMSTMP
jgi:hypothetical protein